MTLTPHFSLEEMTFSEIAVRRGIPNDPGPLEIANLEALAKNVLEPARTGIGGPIHVNSGFRSPMVNALVGGNPNSQHMRGEAADLRPTNATRRELLVWLFENAPFDQLIWEFGAWVHVSFRHEEVRRELLAAYRKPGSGAVYKIVRDPAEAILLVPEAA